MKAVLLSIRPEWCNLIIRGQKTLEVRKTRPKLETPFKVYIYCTRTASKEFNSDDRNWDVSAKVHGGWPDKRGHVIAEFTCDRVDTIIHIQSAECFESAKPGIRDERYFYKPIDDLLQESNLSLQELENYLQGRNGYGWHISDLKIYNQPKDIMCFHRAVEENELWCKKCAIGKKKDVHCAFCYGLDGLRLRRPPQSWCYVEELSNE